MKKSCYLQLWRLPLRLGCLLLVVCASGCLPVPRWNQNHGIPITKTAAAYVKVGQTTRPEVIQALGTNYVSLFRESAIAYAWEGGLTFDWTDFSTTGTGDRSLGRDDSAGAWRAFFVKFDTNGIVAAKAFQSLKLAEPLHQQLDEWACRQPPKK